MLDEEISSLVSSDFADMNYDPSREGQRPVRSVEMEMDKRYRAYVPQSLRRKLLNTCHENMVTLGKKNKDYLVQLLVAKDE